MDPDPILIRPSLTLTIGYELNGFKRWESVIEKALETTSKTQNERTLDGKDQV